MATAWWVVVPPSQAGSGSIPPGAKIASTKVGSDAYNALLNGGTVGGYTRFLGPYNSRAQAAAAKPEGGLQYIGTLVGVAVGAADTGLTGSPGPSGIGAAGAAGGQAVTGGAGGDASCLISLPLVGCILHKTQARALIAGFIIGASGVVAIVGLALLTAEALQRTGAADAAGSTLEHVGAGMAFIPGLQGAGIATAGVGAAAKRAGSRSGASQSVERRRRARAYRQQEAEQGGAA